MNQLSVEGVTVESYSLWTFDFDDGSLLCDCLLCLEPLE